MFTLTCVSTGGLASTVTWTRDGAAATGVTSQTVVDQVTNTYNNTLTVTGRLPGVYNCRVENGGGFDAEARSVTGKGCDVKKCSLTACNFYLDTVFTDIYLVILITLKSQALKNN